MSEKSFTPPEIDYLSKDFTSFRQVMRDHLAALLPEWQEQNPSDMGNALLDLLAYAGDALSYYQDAVATEAYLGTARRRVSIHRHTRLLDYHLHEGCNARTLVQVRVDAEVTLPKQTVFVTRVSEPTVIAAESSVYSQAVAQGVHYFESMHTARLRPAHNEMRFYVAEGADPQLPIGATHAILLDEDRYLDLKPGDILVFKEIDDPETGVEAMADPNKRHAVRLTRVFTNYDAGKALVEIGWHPADALPFSLTLNHFSEDGKTVDISIACGNILIVDYGHTLCDCLPEVQLGERYSPRLTGLALTYSAPLDATQPIRETLIQNPRDSAAAVQLWQVGQPTLKKPEGDRMTLQARKDALVYDAHQARTFFESEGKVYQTIPWLLRQELLNSDELARDYRVELVDTREACLKFGFGGMGWQPQVGDQFVAAYRVGSGKVGNVGIGAIAHIVLPPGSAAAAEIQAEGVSNLLPAMGGLEPESIETARLLAPANLQNQARCVSLADYEAVARRHPDVLNAKAHWQWVATSHGAVVHVLRRDGLPVDREFQQAFQEYIQPYLIVGSDVQVLGPEIIPVYLRLQFVPDPHAPRNAIREALKAAFSADDPAGFFYHSRFTLGQPVYRSQIILWAGQISGIKEVTLLHFCTEAFGEKNHVEQSISVPPTAIIGLERLEIDG